MLTPLISHNTANSTQSLAESLFFTAKHLTEIQVKLAVERASNLRDRKISYELGGKTETALDCSGLTHLCYPMLVHGVVDQYNQLHDWILERDYMICGHSGDLLFFSTVDEPNVVSHNGILSNINLEFSYCSIIWASSSRGYVVEDKFEVRERTFKELLCKGVAQMQPFLIRHFLHEQIEDYLRGSTNG